MSWNINNYSGYDVKSLFVEKKYHSYKQEILQHINMKEYQTLVWFKACEHMMSVKVKGITANRMDAFLHYGIEKDEPITMQHIISLILYCDFSKFCSSFSSTFRKIIGYETLLSVKKRNQEFWWQSKLFRETVEIYGTIGWRDKAGWKNGENGPFYTGVDRVLIVSSFCCRLYAPTSTSKHIEVSMNFATRDGSIVQFNNNGHGGASFLTFFNCRWLSTYNDEDDRIFCGGWMTIRIESIRIVDNCNNYEHWLHALFILDSMLSGTGLIDENDLDMTETDFNMINILLTINNNCPPLIDPYVLSTFKAYIKNKKQITINMQPLDYFCRKHEMNKLIIESGLKNYKTEDINANTFESRYNLISSETFAQFKYVTHIIIETGFVKKFCYGFNLLLFLEVIASSLCWRQIKIQETFNLKTNKTSWIDILWSLSSSKIQTAFHKKHLKIQKTRNKTGAFGKSIKDCLIIERDSP